MLNPNLGEAELVPFLQNAYKELRIGSEQAAALVSVESFQAILKLMNNDKIADLASDVLKCAWGQFQVCFVADINLLLNLSIKARGSIIFD